MKGNQKAPNLRIKEKEIVQLGLSLDLGSGLYVSHAETKEKRLK